MKVSKLNQSECRLHKPNIQSKAEIFLAQLMRELSLVGTQQGNPQERIKHKIKSVHSRY